MTNADSDHELVDTLLPWFVNGTLDPDEHDLVERHAAGCADCRDNIALLARVRNAVDGAQPTPMVPQPKPEALAQAIEARQTQRVPPRVAWVAAAGVAALALIAAIFMPREQAPPLRFETATSDARPLPMDYVLSVRFDDRATPADRERVLKGIGARQVSATDNPSEYRVVVALPAASLADLERYTNELESLPEVLAVKAVALQLPVSPPQ